MAPDEVTNGELMRLCQSIKSDVSAVDRKVDKQGDVITSVNLRLTAIEAKQLEPTAAAELAPRSSGRVLAGGAGIGAGIVGLIQWVITHWR